MPSSILPHLLLLTVGLCSLFQLVSLGIQLSQPSPEIFNSWSDLLFPGREAFRLWVWHACFVSRCFTSSSFILMFVSYPLYPSALYPQLFPSSVLQVTCILGPVSVFVLQFHPWKFCRFNVFMNLSEIQPLQLWYLVYRTCACNFQSGVQCSLFFPPIFFTILRYFIYTWS